ncbi:MAG: diguanylate cyclase [Burkholderiales bacterium]|nr:diguanylate cyclase [Burkholderiales bacterium]MDE2395013.1 diguanylate cyclase [Burkholderiales bacterium]MDE2454562.1 diguanylate cyclase [Burkholderiales bacterium]
MNCVESRPLDVLVVDDSCAPRRAVRAVLESLGHHTHEAADAESALASFERHRPDLVLLDVEMPGNDGYWVARQIRASELGGWTPIIFLSSRADEQSLWSGIEAGGDDYIAKPVSALVLAAKLHAMLRLVRMRERLQDMSDRLQRANSQLRQLSNTDTLTGLLNRRGLEESMQAEIAACRREARPLTLLICDIDHFKRYNDRLGHPAGDACLSHVANVLRTVCRRPRDRAARHGGEEFAIVLPDTPRAGAMTFAHGLQRMLQASALPHPDSPVHPLVTISSGFATCIPDAATTIHDLMLRADEALYEAKSRGRNRFCGFAAEAVASISFVG